MMLKQTIIYFILSVMIVLFAEYFHLLIVYIDLGYTFINLKLASFFNGAPYGSLLRNIVTLVLLPIVMVGIPAALYQLIKKQPMPHFMEILWLVWVIIVLSKVLVH